MARLPPGSATYVVFRKRRARHQAIRALEFTIAAARYPSIWGTGRQFCRRALSAQIDLYGGSGVLAVLDEQSAGRHVVDVDACGYVTIPARTGVVELGQALVLRLSHGAGDH